MGSCSAIITFLTTSFKNSHKVNFVTKSQSEFINSNFFCE